TTAIGSRSASRRIATICSSVNLVLRMLPSIKEGSLSTNPWSENPGAGQLDPPPPSLRRHMPDQPSSPVETICAEATLIERSLLTRQELDGNIEKRHARATHVLPIVLLELSVIEWLPHLLCRIPRHAAARRIETQAIFRPRQQGCGLAEILLHDV